MKAEKEFERATKEERERIEREAKLPPREQLRAAQRRADEFRKDSKKPPFM